ncbi:MAG TPA: FxLYD domain-containing protein [Dehalococcoidia bacterium]|nr:FxLYD domain-containing protein [Dehalococcoidia bacterium]
MRRIRIFRRSSMIRLGAVGLLAALGVLGLGARCLEGVSVYVDSEGYTHITGRLVNDTGIQGAELMLRGTLYDAGGNVIATKDAAPCPPDLQPNSEISFDIRFDNPNVPPHASYSVNVISGKALPQPLPDPDVVLFSAEAIRFEGIPPIPGLPISDEDVLFAFAARNRSQNTYLVQGCAVVLNNRGEVIAAINDEIVEIDQNGNISPARLRPSKTPVGVYMFAEDVPTGPVQVKAWLWFAPKGARTSQWQYVSTGLFTIQVERF